MRPLKPLNWAALNLGAALVLLMAVLAFETSAWPLIPNLLGAVFFLSMHLGKET